jgi:hypothetical protein
LMMVCSRWFACASCASARSARASASLSAADRPHCGGSFEPGCPVVVSLFMESRPGCGQSRLFLLPRSRVGTQAGCPVVGATCPSVAAWVSESGKQALRARRTGRLIHGPMVDCFCALFNRRKSGALRGTGCGSPGHHSRGTAPIRICDDPATRATLRKVHRDPAAWSERHSCLPAGSFPRRWRRRGR